METITKSERLLHMYSRLVNGEILQKNALAQQFGVNERSIRRDIESLRCFLSEQGLMQEISYDRGLGGYRMENPEWCALKNSEVLAVCKILLESRSLRRDEMFPILDKLITCCVPQEKRRAVRTLLANEKFHYIEPHHQKSVLDMLWELGNAVRSQKVIEIEYERLKEPHFVKRRVLPVGIMFSEYYFYLCAYISVSEDTPDVVKHPFPTIYRIDRIAEYEILDEHFRVPYADRFQEGEFRKRIQFMFGGELRTIRFKYKGLSIESVLDRFPTAEIIDYDETGWTIKAEVYGDGVDIWLRGQGDIIEIIDGGKK